MKRQAILAIVFAAIFPFSITNAQQARVTSGKKTSWIESVSYDLKGKPDEGEGASYYYLLMDEQENTLLQEDYYHYIYTILTTEGIQEMADFSVSYDPAYQELTFHEIKVMRGNSTIDQLSIKDIRIIQREESMDRSLYDGSKTAIVNLKDIRVGDIVEYSFTRKGYNPVHQNHIARTSYFDFYQSSDKYFRKLILPASANVTLKTLGEGVPEPVIKQAGNTTQYTWLIEKPKASQDVYYTPGWYNTSRIAMLSDFATWGDVGNWARGLFTVSATDREKIRNEVAPSFKSSHDGDYLLEVIRFVQDEVRYLGFETGINSHQPHPPLQVYQQRFGDCKDKSLLLTTLLQARGIEAYPMLVNTSLKDKIDERLPSGSIFDHCVVQIIFNNKKIYIDPTWSNQGGEPDHYYFPDYRRGLVIDDHITGLDTLPEPEPSSTSEIHEFDMKAPGGETLLSIRTTYTGADADYQRAEFARTPLENIQKNFTEYYANLYPDIASNGDLKFTDSRNDNVFIVEEHYKIPTFWKPVPDEPNKYTGVIQPMPLTTYFDVPKNIQQRSTPYALSYPVDIYHNIHVRVPEEWSIAPIDDVIENEFYQYEYTVKKNGREISKNTHYKTKSDHIPPDRVAEYVADHTKMYNQLVYEFTYDQNVANAAGNTLPGIAISIVTIVGGVFLMFALYHQYDPKPARYMVAGSPIGGWLILVALGVLITPLRMLYELLSNTDLLTGTAWLSWLSAKRYDLFGFILFTQIYNILKLLFSVLLIVLFFQRRTSFPRLMSIQLALNFIFISADLIVARAITEDPSSLSYRDVAQSFIGAAIWIPYLNISQRVRETFVIQKGGDDDNDPAEIDVNAEVAGEKMER